MKRHLTKSRMIVGAAVIVAIAVGGGAFAYFTSSGSGTGTATVGSSAAVTLSSDAVTGLFPGGVDVPVTVHITNPGSGAERVGTVSGTVADNAGCLGTWFEVDSVVYDATLAPGASDTASTVVRMLDSNTNQDVCQGKAMTINWTSN